MPAKNGKGQHTKRRPRRQQSPAGPRRRSYHHGSLREALIEAALRLVEESGPQSVTVREASRRAGVSSGAPFRHFPDRTALMTAVAEEAMTKLRQEVITSLEHTRASDPLERFRAVGAAYLRWTVNHPTHFQVISDRSLIDFDSSDVLRGSNQELRTILEDSLAEAQRRKLIDRGDLLLVALAGRALVYGLARMYVDGHFPQWGVAAGGAQRAMEKALDVFVDALRRGTRGDSTLRRRTRLSSSDK
jgi:AcrR family transcriptional regulator